LVSPMKLERERGRERRNQNYSSKKKTKPTFLNPFPYNSGGLGDFFEGFCEIFLEG
jgi:hypothetical protein